MVEIDGERAFVYYLDEAAFLREAGRTKSGLIDHRRSLRSGLAQCFRCYKQRHKERV